MAKRHMQQFKISSLFDSFLSKIVDQHIVWAKLHEARCELEYCKSGKKKRGEAYVQSKDLLWRLKGWE